MSCAFRCLNRVNGRHLEIIADDHDGRIVRKSRVRDDGMRDIHLGCFINKQDIEASRKTISAKPEYLVSSASDNSNQVCLTKPVAHVEEFWGATAGEVRT
jgi:hypothetical protein